MKTIEVQNGLTFDVSEDGTIHQPHCVSPCMLDNVRVYAAQEFLAERGLSKESRRYWASVALISPPNARLS